LNISHSRVWVYRWTTICIWYTIEYYVYRLKICNNNNKNKAAYARIHIFRDTFHLPAIPVHCRDDRRGTVGTLTRYIRLTARGRPSSSSPSRRQVLSSAYVVQIDSSRESLYLMRLPNGVRLKRCSHHRRKLPPRRLQP
jgi:hypothetical protein